MVHFVACAIIRRMSHLIAWPDSADHRRRIAQRFFSLFSPGLPNICGAIDGSLIPIQAPAVDEENENDDFEDDGAAAAVQRLVNSNVF
jgi:hypothetical protein